jgi:hypothetical protein
MTFQIFNAADNSVINLNDFDALYCKECGVEESDYHYARWYHVMECVFNIYGDLGDASQHGDFYVATRVLGHKNVDTRKLNMTQVARCLLIWLGTSMFDSDEIKDIDKAYQYVHQVVKFCLDHKEDFYFEFSF